MTELYLNEIFNESVCKGSQILNELSTDELTELLNKLSLECTDQGLLNIFSNKYTVENSTLAINTMRTIISESNKYLMKPTDFQDCLMNTLGLKKPAAECLVKFWTEKVTTDLDCLQNKNTVKSIQWELQVETANEIQSKITVPKAVIQLALLNQVGSKDNLTLRLCENELNDLYSKLESIQMLLDSKK